MAKTMQEKLEEEGFKSFGGGDQPIFEFEEEGDSIVGVLTEVRDEVGAHKSKMYIIENREDNVEYAVWGTTVLDRRLSRAVIGDQIGIVYLGKKKPKAGGKPYDNFDTFIKENFPSEDVNKEDLPFS